MQPPSRTPAVYGWLPVPRPPVSSRRVTAVSHADRLLAVAAVAARLSAHCVTARSHCYRVWQVSCMLSAGIFLLCDCCVAPLFGFTPAAGSIRGIVRRATARLHGVG